MSRPLVSVVVPAFNAAATIEDAIDSMLAQTCGDWELLIVDDGSTDETPVILARQRDPRVRVFRQKNSGVGAARNTALSAATGEFIAFLDADDVLPPDSLAIRVDYLRENMAVDIVNGCVRITEGGSLSWSYRPSTTIQRLFPRLVALDEEYFFGLNYMIRRSRIGDHRFPEGLSHCEDLCFFLKVADDIDLIYGAVDEDVYVYRRRAGSAMSDLDGIESGYVALVCLASTLEQATYRQVVRLKFRVALILAKSWLRRGNLIRVVGSAFRVWRAAR